MKRQQKEPRRRRAARSAITIREIAIEAGVSTATVSRVLNEPEKVRVETRDAVLEIITKRHFVFDGTAVSLASRRTRTLGLVIPSITNSIYASSTQAIQSTAQEAGYTVLVGISEFSPAAEAQLIHRLLERRVDGLILTGSTRAPDIYDKIRSNRVPFVITWRLARDPQLPSVSFDNYAAARMAVEHLISLGHRRIGLICGRADINDRAAERRRGYEDMLKSSGISIDQKLIFERDFEFVEGRAAMHRMLQLADPPTAVFCANDIQAVGALNECIELGVAVPDRMSLIGFDDLPIVQYTIPKLSTVRVPAAEMGRRAVRELVDHLERDQPLSSIELQTDLIIRRSTARPGQP